MRCTARLRACNHVYSLALCRSTVRCRPTSRQAASPALLAARMAQHGLWAGTQSFLRRVFRQGCLASAGRAAVRAWPRIPLCMRVPRLSAKPSMPGFGLPVVGLASGRKHRHIHAVWPLKAQPNESVALGQGTPCPPILVSPPNPSLKLTHYGMRCLAAPGAKLHYPSAAKRRIPPRSA